MVRTIKVFFVMLINDFRKLVGSKGGDLLPGEPSTWLEGWNCQYPPPLTNLLGGNRGWRLTQSPITNDSINNDYAMKVPYKPKSFRGFLCWWTCQRAWKLCDLSPNLAHCISSVWLFLSIILLQWVGDLVISEICFSEFCELLYQINQTRGVGDRNLWFISVGQKYR